MVRVVSGRSSGTESESVHLFLLGRFMVIVWVHLSPWSVARSYNPSRSLWLLDMTRTLVISRSTVYTVYSSVVMHN